MSIINPTLPNSELIKIEVDKFQSLSMERKKNIKMETEMVNLVRELLKKEVDLLERTQSLTMLEKCSLEEKLGRSERRCEELDEKVKRMRQKKMESEKAARFYKRRVDDLELRMLKLEAAFANVLNVNLANLDKFVAAATDGNGGIGLSKKGSRNLAYSGTEEGGANLACSGKVRLQDNIEDTKPEFRGANYRMKLECRCRLKIIDVIKDNLQKENLEIFEQSCFGNLLMINKLTFQGQLISQLLLHMDMSASNEERLIFKINNSNLEFGPSDFFRITGLRFGKLEKTISKKSSSIHEGVFQGRPIITLKDVEEAFLNISNRHKGKGELTLKLALLYFLYGTLLAKRCRNKIDVQYLHLIEDLQKFNAFPWGRVAYDFLVLSILQLDLHMDDSEVTHQVARFDLYGFCYGLQIWAYEVMPCAAMYCASRTNNFENITPWILRWSVTKILTRANDLKKFFHLGNKAHLNTTRKWEELSTNTIPHVATPHNRTKQKKRKFLCDNDQMHHAQPSSAATPTTPPPPSLNASTYSYHHLFRNNTMGKQEELSTNTTPHVAAPLNRAIQKKRKLLSDNDRMPHAQPSSAATPPPSTNASTFSSHHIARRLSRAEGILDSLLRKVEQPILDISYDEIPRNEFPRVDDVEDKSAATLTRHSTSGSNPVSMNKATDEHARALSEVAYDNPETNAHVVQSETMQKQALVGRSPSSGAVDVVIICDSEGDDDEAVAASDSQYKNSDDDECLSDRYMNKLVVELKRKASGK